MIDKNAPPSEQLGMNRHMQWEAKRQAELEKQMTEQLTEFQQQLMDAAKRYSCACMNAGRRPANALVQRNYAALRELVMRAVDKKALELACEDMEKTLTVGDWIPKITPGYWITKAEENKEPKGYTCPEGHHTDFPARGYMFNFSTGETITPAYCKPCDKSYEEEK